MNEKISKKIILGLQKTAFLDYLTGNLDRHAFNLYHNKQTGQVDAIDNGGAFMYGDRGGRIKKNLDSLGHLDIDPLFRKGILNADDDHLRNLFSRVAKSPYAKTGKDYGRYMRDNNYRYPKNGFLAGNFEPGEPMEAHRHFDKRLKQLQGHLNDPGVRTYRDLADVLYQ